MPYDMPGPRDMQEEQAAEWREKKRAAVAALAPAERVERRMKNRAAVYSGKEKFLPATKDPPEGDGAKENF